MTTQQTVTRAPAHSVVIDEPRTGSTAAAIALAVLRLSMGFVFLWGFPRQDLRPALLDPIGQGVDTRRITDERISQVR